MRFRKPKVRPETCAEAEQEARLVDAEKRVNVLVATAEWIHNAVAARDEKNHWQDSVDGLFLGGKP